MYTQPILFLPLKLKYCALPVCFPFLQIVRLSPSRAASRSLASDTLKILKTFLAHQFICSTHFDCRAGRVVIHSVLNNSDFKKTTSPCYNLIVPVYVQLHFPVMADPECRCPMTF